MNEKNIKTEMNENEKRNNIQKKNKIVGELNPIYKNNIFSNFKSLSLEKQKNSNNIIPYIKINLIIILYVLKC